MKSDGQSTLEYLLVFLAVLLAVLFAVRQGGPIQTEVPKIFDSTANQIGKAVDASAQRINF